MCKREKNLCKEETQFILIKYSSNMWKNKEEKKEDHI